MPVHPDVVGRVHAVEAQDDVAARPACRNRERRAVGRDGIVVGPQRVAVANRGEVRVRRMAEVGVRIALVGVAGRPEAAHLDAARHIDREPVRIVEVRLPEVLHAQVGIARPRELPVAVQDLPVGRLGLQRVRERVRLVRKRHRIRARRQTVDGVDRRIFPRFGRKSPERQARRANATQNLRHLHFHFPVHRVTS